MTGEDTTPIRAQNAYDAIKAVAADQLGLFEETDNEIRSILTLARTFSPEKCGFIIVHNTHTMFLWHKDTVPEHLPMWQHGILKSPPDVSYFWYDGTYIQSVDKPSFFQHMSTLQEP